ncbi:metallophosphoesterase [Candidatus Endoriftia persephone]|jgi:predicted MPP superfamily phosphohydrolase|uniref:Metallophosphoesterase n=3 Tax=Gammaproteobacteria TaxID=1236 RepID=G2FBL5_9GAMM|nr:metallophosphoesterase [Candidatus Endoriftia persephone]EGV52697.1 metallophosphoesterase [endosymbiont of Riftia pachyptila (vent Ph05)]EGW55696.1 metallophosphoesterase [endosymbiont of Tevnia jerichonana (vent Tica)]USF86315.1 metallophosphoesterase family protein [Candidatus Endoriftia persephone]
MEQEIRQQLEQRLGRLHARLRLGIEEETKPRVFGNGINFFHPENWYSVHSLIRNSLRLVGLYRRGLRNTLDIQVRRHEVTIKGLSPEFDGYTLLQLSDIHADIYPPAVHAMVETVRELEYDACVLTGDYRAQTHGPVEAAIEWMGVLMSGLRQPVYGVLGNHDSVTMLPALEAMGIRMLLNEHQFIERGEARIYLVGIDDAHYFRVDNIEKAAHAIPLEAVSILLSHTPEIYRQAAHAGFNLMLCGHTHGGQICLPGGIPITLDAKCPRYMGSGPWDYNGMRGYTSVGTGSSIVNVRLNCPPEVTLHRLRAAL